MAKFVLSLIFLLASVALASAETHAFYSAAFNSFNDYPTSAATMKDDLLMLRNPADSALILLSERPCPREQFRYMARFANVKAKKHGVTPASCGIVFCYADARNYLLLEMAPFHSHPFYEMLDKRTLKVSLSQVADGEKRLLEAREVATDVDLYDGLNALCVEVDKGTVNVKVGDKNLHHLFTAEIPASTTGTKVGLLLSPTAEMALERTVLSYSAAEKSVVTTQWTREALDAHFAASANPFEGYWEYLDRDMDDALARIGGKYRIALVDNGNGFDVIYIAGAQVKKSEWKEGMLKARFTKTIFTDNYTATWTDATFRPLTD
ncbi:MAG: hypothetical protein Q4B68_07150, partial [Bacteroidales bacterium]|nr:hypothetical protein [Bacteroidales bacterium]